MVQPVALADKPSDGLPFLSFRISGWGGLQDFYDNDLIPGTLGTWVSWALGYNAPDVVSVPCDTLDSFAQAQLPDRGIDFLKIDCEGGEEAALQGAEFLLSQVPSTTPAAARSAPPPPPLPSQEFSFTPERQAPSP